MKKGFTLAEVLITLAIIGVVAALTIPTIIVNYQKKQYYTQFMKDYNTFVNALDLSAVDNGNPATWDYNLAPDEFFDRYLKNYLKKSEKIDLPEYNLYTLDGTLIGQLNQLVKGGGGSYASDYAFVLADGSLLGVAVMVDSMNCFLLDINGEKGPNKMGRDLYTLRIYYDKNEPQKGYYVSSQYPLEDDNASCSLEGDGGMTGMKGHGCTARLLKDGKMDY